MVVLTNSSSGNPEFIARGVAARYEPNLKLPSAAPIDDAEPAVTQRLNQLVDQLIAGKLDNKQFRQLTPEVAARYVEYYGARLKPLGALVELRLFRRGELGDDALYDYRARFEKGLMDVSFALDPGNKVSQFALQPVDQLGRSAVAVMHAMKTPEFAVQPPYLLFLADVTDIADSKTAAGIRQWRGELCAGQLRFRLHRGSRVAGSHTAGSRGSRHQDDDHRHRQ